MFSSELNKNNAMMRCSGESLQFFSLQNHYNDLSKSLSFTHNNNCKKKNNGTATAATTNRKASGFNWLLIALMIGLMVLFADVNSVQAERSVLNYDLMSDARMSMNQYGGVMTLATTQQNSSTPIRIGGYVTNYKVFIGRNCTPENNERDCGGLEALVCINNKCSFCTNSSQCSEQVHNIYSCHKKGNENICEHKDLFEYVSWMDILATITCFIGGVLSAASGTGGGGVFVPLLHVAGQFPPTLAIPISTLMIFGAGIINIATLSFKRHPHADRPLIDYDIALMMEPPTLLGTIIGVFFNMMFPDWLIVVLVILTLSITSFVMFKNGYKRFKKESEDRKKLEESSGEENHNDNNNPTTVYDGVDGDEESLLKVEQTSSNIIVTESSDEIKIEHQNEDQQSDDGVGYSTRSPEEQKELQQMYEAEKKTPFGKVIVLFVCWMTVFTLSLLKGGHGAPSIIPTVTQCSVGYWILTALSFPLLGAMTLGIVFYLLKKHERKVQIGYQFVEGDVHWNKYNVTLYPIACVGAGILASMLGIGGGMVKSPLLLILGSDPVSSQATTSFMILFTSSISTVQYLIAGLLPVDYGLWFLACGILCGVFGQLILDLWLDKSGRRSLMIFIVAFVTLAATFLMGGAGIYDVVKQVEKGVYMGFRSPCL